MRAFKGWLGFSVICAFIIYGASFLDKSTVFYLIHAYAVWFMVICQILYWVMFFIVRTDDGEDMNKLENKMLAGAALVCLPLFFAIGGYINLFEVSGFDTGGAFMSALFLGLPASLIVAVISMGILNLYREIERHIP